MEAMQERTSKAIIGALAIGACLVILAVIGLLAFWMNRPPSKLSPELKNQSSVERRELADCGRCTSVWRVTLYSSDEWFDTGIKLKKGESINIFATPGGLTGFSGTFLIKLNGKEERCCLGRSPVKFDQNLLLRYIGKSETGIFQEYLIADVRIMPWEF